MPHSNFCIDNSSLQNAMMKPPGRPRAGEPLETPVGGCPMGPPVSSPIALSGVKELLFGTLLPRCDPSGARQRSIANAVGPVGGGAQAALPVGVVLTPVALEAVHLAVALER